MSLEFELLVGPGRWLIVTESASYLLELDSNGQGHLVRHPGEGEGVAPEAAELPPPIAVELRGDREEVSVLWAEVPTVGRPWRLYIDVRGDGITTLRTTNFVRQIVSDPLPDA